MRHRVIAIAKDAGQAIMDIYRSQQLQTREKEDGSPVTEADLEAHRIIESELKNSFAYPVISEETYSEEKPYSRDEAYWLVDPLDGTKEFIAGNGQFTVNIALIQGGKPIFGVVYHPVSQDCYSAEHGVAYKNDISLHAGSEVAMRRGLASRSHRGKTLEEFYLRNGISEVEYIGSSIKFCMVAEGAADIYARFNPTSEWDTAAGQAIAEAAGCEVLQMETKESMVYGKSSIQNPGFYVVRRGVSVRFLK